MYECFEFSEWSFKAQLPMLLIFRERRTSIYKLLNIISSPGWYSQHCRLMQTSNHNNFALPHIVIAPHADCYGDDNIGFALQFYLEFLQYKGVTKSLIRIDECRYYVIIVNGNDNDNENNFIVMNYIGTMTAVKLNIASRHLNIACEYWHSILKFMTKGAWSLGSGPNICLHYLLWGAGKRLIVTNYKLTHCGPAWQVSSRGSKILFGTSQWIHMWWLHADLNELIVVQLKTRYCIYIFQQYAYKIPNWACLST